MSESPPAAPAEDAAAQPSEPKPASGGSEPVPSRRRAGLRRVGWALAVTGLVLLPLCGRAAWEGHAELERADEARDAGDADGEILHLGRAARWRTPVLSHDETARARLLEIGEAALQQGESSDHVALAAFREVRGALLATRTLGVADDDQLSLANARIATLMAAQEARFGTDVGGTGDPQAWHLAQLDAPPGPVPWRATVAALAFVAWLAATGGFVLRGLDAAGRLRPKAAVRWGAASLLTLVAWAWMLATARG